MSNNYVTNTAKLIEQLSRFTSFIQQIDGRSGFISFRDGNGFLGREEDYKSRIAEEARKALNFNNWNESWIGTGKIAKCAIGAMNKSGNLVNSHQQIDFKNRLNPKHAEYRPDAERVLYDIYRNPHCDESLAFINAVEAFGRKYATIAFLFFIKDDTRFLPISPSHFDQGFTLLGINYTTSFRCSWENYQGFLDVIKEIKTFMEDMLPMQGTLRLIDAHSFVWIIQTERFTNWVPGHEQSVQIEVTTEEYLRGVVIGSGVRRTVTTSTFARSTEVATETRKRANGYCQLCNQRAPFKDKKGNPYLEVHHVTWLSRGGEDSTANTVALCPNCHSRMHVLDNSEDIEKLREILNSAT